MAISMPDTIGAVGDLPGQVDSFIGREDTFRQAERLLETARLVTITGPGGVGKTRLALQLARSQQESGAWPGGVWLAELTDLTPGAGAQRVAREIAETLGVSAQGTAPPLTVLGDALAGATMLLVVDNCEHVLGAAATVLGRLVEKAPGMRIIATSRHVLGVRAENIVRVPPLSTPEPGALSSVEAAGRWEAAELFIARARAAVPAFELSVDNLTQVSDLIAALDGLPLAIELAAQQMRRAPLSEIARRRNDRLALLGGTAHAGPRRHRTLRGSIDWSDELCSPAERLVWARCSVFSGGFDAHAAEEVCAGDGIKKGEVFDLLGELVDQSLLMVGAQDRYSPLASHRDYSAELLRAYGEEARLRERHAEYYRQLAIRAGGEWWGGDQLRWLARLQRERANIRAAITHYLATPGGAAGAMEIISALRAWWSALFPFSEARENLEAALAADPRPTRQRAAALWAGGYVALRQGDLTAADGLLTESRAVAEAVQDRPSLSSATHLLGLAAYFRGQTTTAVELLRQAETRCTQLGDEAGAWMAWCHLAMATAAAGDHDAAQEYGRRCLEAAGARTALLSRSGALWALGWGRWLARDVPAAERLLAEGLAIMREHADLWGVAECQEVLAWIAAGGGRDEYAARLLGAAQAARQQIGASIPGLRPLAIRHDDCVARLRGRLGDRAYDAAIAAGVRGELSVLPAAAPPPPDDGALAMLTEREREVIELIARGMSSKKIGERLFVSDRTIDSHAEHIRDKLGLQNRAEIAAFYIRATKSGLPAGGVPHAPHTVLDVA